MSHKDQGRHLGAGVHSPHFWKEKFSLRKLVKNLNFQVFDG